MLSFDYRPAPIRPRANNSAAEMPSPDVKQPLIRSFSRQPSTTTTTSLICRTPSSDIPEASSIEALSHPGYLGMDKQRGGGRSVPNQPRESAPPRRETQQATSEENVSHDETKRLLDAKTWMIPRERLTLEEDIGSDIRPDPIRPEANNSAVEIPSPDVKQPLIRSFSKPPSTTTTTSQFNPLTPSVESVNPETSPNETNSLRGFLGMDKHRGGGRSVPNPPVGSGRHRRGTEQATSEESVSLEETKRLLVAEGWIIPREQLTLVEEFGSGQYGCVYKGKYRCAGKGNTEVAVKTIRDSPDNTLATVKEFLNEGLQMKDFKHEHIVELIGICFENGLPMIVLPFMPNGDLCAYLRDKYKKLWVVDLLKFATHIASGMSYLAKEKFVHRDLASRNCLIDGDMKVKVADFGLSRDVYESEYYVTETKQRKLPIRWMAPECVELEKFTVHSDVWSYGIVLWEIMTRGVLPYEKLDNWSVLYFLKDLKQRLPQPEYCSNELYHVMMRCWEYDPKERPSFEEIHDAVKHLWTSAAYKDRIQSAPAQNELYCNVE